MEIFYEVDGDVIFRPDIAEVFVSQDGECCRIYDCILSCEFIVPKPNDDSVFRYEIYGRTDNGRGPTIFVDVDSSSGILYHSIIVPKSSQLVEVFMPINKYQPVPNKP